MLGQARHTDENGHQTVFQPHLANTKAKAIQDSVLPCSAENYALRYDTSIL